MFGCNATEVILWRSLNFQLTQIHKQDPWHIFLCQPPPPDPQTTLSQMFSLELVEVTLWPTQFCSRRNEKSQGTGSHKTSSPTRYRLLRNTYLICECVNLLFCFNLFYLFFFFCFLLYYILYSTVIIFKLQIRHLTLF